MFFSDYLKPVHKSSRSDKLNLAVRFNGRKASESSFVASATI